MRPTFQELVDDTLCAKNGKGPSMRRGPSTGTFIRTSQDTTRAAGYAIGRSSRLHILSNV